MVMDKDLEELLKTTFEVNEHRAKFIATKVSFDIFLNNFSRLESLIGFQNGAEVVKNGRFLDHQNGEIDVYFQLAYDVAGKMDSKLPIPPKPFYSIESLKEYLGIKETIPQVEQGKLDITVYRILKSDDTLSVRYLKSLIDSGELSVDRNDYWGKAETSGVRGLDILRRVSFQLNQIFNDFGFERPEIHINHGQYKIKINDSAREKLEKIRDIAYAVQKPTGK